MTSNWISATWRTAAVALLLVAQAGNARAAVHHVQAEASADSTKPGFYVAYWNRNAIQEWVAVYSRDGRALPYQFGPYQGTALVATDSKRNLFVADLGAGIVKAYAPGGMSPYKTFALAATSGSGAMAVDGRGNVWVGLGCGGSYCSIPGSLTEYAPSGTVVQQFPQCLLSYDAVGVDQRGDAFAAGTVSVSPPDWKAAIVEYPAGATVCRTILRNDALVNWGGGLAVTHKGDLVLDFNGASTSYLETLGGPAHRRVVARTSVYYGGYYAGLLALTRDDTDAWVGFACCNEWLGLKFSLTGGGQLLRTVGGFEENYLVASMAAVD